MVEIPVQSNTRRGHLSIQCSRLIAVICLGVSICVNQLCQNGTDIASGCITKPGPGNGHPVN
jgi:hypothetical protein